jgi:NADP-dependent aldehyde dehydrogenase
MNLTGRSIIGHQSGSATGTPFQGINPVTGKSLPGDFYGATEEEVDRAAELSRQAFRTYGRTDAKMRAAFLRKIAENMEAVAADISERATAETGLTAARIAGETARTTGQLRLYAGLIEEGSWLDARIDTALPDRKPLPKPDLRSMLRPLGPVVVFCASNFPLAYSVAGGDTASALAAGNPVIVNAHQAHPGTAELVGQLVAKAVRDCNLPEGTFSMLHGVGYGVGQALVRHPAVSAVGFTGSRTGGRALYDIAASRPSPIPVYAEMSSVNPVFLLPGALSERKEQIAKGLHVSLTSGAGQFCTNPGLLLALDNEVSASFKEALKALVAETPPTTMLHHGIREAYERGVARRVQRTDFSNTLVLECDKGPGGCDVVPAIFSTSADTYFRDATLEEEIFGPCTTFIDCPSGQDMLRIAESLGGHLTASVFATGKDLSEHAELVAILERKVGRLIINQFPTGVEVCDSIVHGGPYPATTDGRSTSVGTAAILRFTRPVCFQNFPQGSLPAELKDENPLHLLRKVNGTYTRESIS